jgi:hypothetical protein
MAHERLHYTRAAKVRLELLPAEVRVHLETHLENLALLLEATPQLLPGIVERFEDCFVTGVQEVRALFTLDTSARTLLVHRVESSAEAAGVAAAFELPETDAAGEGPRGG